MIRLKHFYNNPGHLVSIPGCVIPKTFKMVLDTSLLKTKQYEVRIKGKVEQSREKSSAPLHLGIVAIGKGVFWSPSITVAGFTILFITTKSDICWNHVRNNNWILSVVLKNTTKWNKILYLPNLFTYISLGLCTLFFLCVCFFSIK